MTSAATDAEAKTYRVDMRDLMLRKGNAALYMVTNDGQVADLRKASQVVEPSQPAAVDAPKANDPVDEAMKPSRRKKRRAAAAAARRR